MKSMKKIICGLTAAVMLAVCALPVFAAGINPHEKAVLDELRVGATVDGVHYNIPSQYINQAENWAQVDCCQRQDSYHYRCKWDYRL